MSKAIVNDKEAIFECIKDYIEENKISPTLEEVREKLGIKSASSVSYYVEQFIEEGRLIRRAKGARTITLP